VVDGMDRKGHTNAPNPVLKKEKELWKVEAYNCALIMLFF
jgi:hypothetical protein